MGRFQILLNVFNTYQRLKGPFGFILKFFIGKNKKNTEKAFLKKSQKSGNIIMDKAYCKKISFVEFKKIDIIKSFKKFKKLVKLCFELKNIVFNLRIRSFMKSRR